MTGWIPRRGFAQSTFQCPIMPQLGHGPGGGLGFRHERAHAFFAAFEAGPTWLPFFVG